MNNEFKKIMGLLIYYNCNFIFINYNKNSLLEDIQINMMDYDALENSWFIMCYEDNFWCTIKKNNLEEIKKISNTSINEIAMAILDVEKEKRI